MINFQNLPERKTQIGENLSKNANIYENSLNEDKNLQVKLQSDEDSIRIISLDGSLNFPFHSTFLGLNSSNVTATKKVLFSDLQNNLFDSDENIKDDDSENAYEGIQKAFDSMMSIQKKFKSNSMNIRKYSDDNSTEKTNFDIKIFKNYFFNPNYHEYQTWKEHLKYLRNEVIYSLKELTNEKVMSKRKIRLCDQKKSYFLSNYP